MRHIFLNIIAFFLCVLILVKCGKKSIKPDSVRASSSLSENNYTHAPENTLDGVTKTAWVDGNGKASGVGEWLEYTFSTPANIGKIVITSGYQKIHETQGSLYELNSRPKSINVLINGTVSQRISLVDSKEAQEFSLDNAKSVRTLRLMILADYKGKRWNDMAITDVQFLSTGSSGGDQSNGGKKETNVPLNVESFANLNKRLDDLIKANETKSAETFCKGMHKFEATVLESYNSDLGKIVILYDQGDAKVPSGQSEQPARPKHTLACHFVPDEIVEHLNPGRKIIVSGYCNGATSRGELLFAFENCTFPKF